MKKYILVLAIALYSCNDAQVLPETCTTCTRVVTVNSNHTYAATVYSQETIFEETMTEGNCILPHLDYQAKIQNQSESEIASLNALNPRSDVDPNTGATFQYDVVMQLNYIICTEN